MFRFRNLIIIPGLLGKFDTREDRNEKHENKRIHLHLKNLDLYLVCFFEKLESVWRMSPLSMYD